ncbi:MAG: M14 family metallopeptidase [Chloroflexota bacterium]|nr:M14 family metallopeptidase [Chloroflexota bacterium]
MTPRSALAMATAPAPRSVTLPTDAPTALMSSADRSTPLSSDALIAPIDLITSTGDTSGIVGETVGVSHEGRAIDVYRFGTGARVLLLVGGMHGGYEANTVILMRRLIAHFQTTTDAVPGDAALWIIPVANPDGLAYGGGERGRFNGRGVDLNRNWGCDWSRDAVWRQTQVNPGIASFSEPETQAIADFILAHRPAAALFYHSAANGVFPGNCGGDHGSAGMAALYAVSADYACCAAFSAYPVTGTAATWADGQGIPAADVELTTRDSPEFERNLRGVLALLAWASG